jgi:hypothetical protein
VKALVERIRQEGKNLGRGILKVEASSIINLIHNLRWRWAARLHGALLRLVFRV